MSFISNIDLDPDKNQSFEHDSADSIYGSLTSSCHSANNTLPNLDISSQNPTVPLLSESPNSIPSNPYRNQPRGYSDSAYGSLASSCHSDYNTLSSFPSLSQNPTVPLLSESLNSIPSNEQYTTTTTQISRNNDRKRSIQSSMALLTNYMGQADITVNSCVDDWRDKIEALEITGVIVAAGKQSQTLGRLEENGQELEKGEEELNGRWFENSQSWMDISRTAMWERKRRKESIRFYEGQTVKSIREERGEQMDLASPAQNNENHWMNTSTSDNMTPSPPIGLPQRDPNLPTSSRYLGKYEPYIPNIKTNLNDGTVPEYGSQIVVGENNDLIIQESEKLREEFYEEQDMQSIMEERGEQMGLTSPAQNNAGENHRKRRKFDGGMEPAIKQQSVRANFGIQPRDGLTNSKQQLEMLVVQPENTGNQINGSYRDNSENIDPSAGKREENIDELDRNYDKLINDTIEEQEEKENETPSIDNQEISKTQGSISDEQIVNIIFDLQTVPETTERPRNDLEFPVVPNCAEIHEDNLNVLKINTSQKRGVGRPRAAQEERIENAVKKEEDLKKEIEDRQKSGLPPDERLEQQLMEAQKEQLRAKNALSKRKGYEKKKQDGSEKETVNTVKSINGRNINRDGQKSVENISRKKEKEIPKSYPRQIKKEIRTRDRGNPLGLNPDRQIGIVKKLITPQRDCSAEIRQNNLLALPPETIASLQHHPTKNLQDITIILLNEMKHVASHHHFSVQETQCTRRFSSIDEYFTHGFLQKEIMCIYKTQTTLCQKDPKKEAQYLLDLGGLVTHNDRPYILFKNVCNKLNEKRVDICTCQANNCRITTKYELDQKKISDKRWRNLIIITHTWEIMKLEKGIWKKKMEDDKWVEMKTMPRSCCDIQYMLMVHDAYSCSVPNT